MAEINLAKLKKLKLKGETLQDTLDRLCNVYVYPYDPKHGFPVTPYHLDYKGSLASQCHKRGFSIPNCEQARQGFRTEKGYQKWLKQLEKIPKHLKGEI